MEVVERDYTNVSASVTIDDLKYMKDNKLSVTVVLRRALALHREGVKEKNRLIRIADFRQNLIILGLSVMILMFAFSANSFLIGMGGFIIFITLISFVVSNLLSEGVRYYKRKRRI